VLAPLITIVGSYDHVGIAYLSRLCDLVVVKFALLDRVLGVVRPWLRSWDNRRFLAFLCRKPPRIGVAWSVSVDWVVLSPASALSLRGLAVWLSPRLGLLHHPDPPLW